jgi:biopolymer transport protein ExbD
MRLRHIHHHSTAGKINVTPLIDVVMVLIVFYLIVGKLASDRAAPVQLPRLEGGAQAPERGVIVSVMLEGGAPVVLVDGARVERAQLAGAILAKLPGGEVPPISLRADRRLTYDQVRPVIDACRRAGVPAVKLVTTRAGAPEGAKPQGANPGGAP